MAIQWLRYPVDVKQSVRIIPVQVQLPAGSVVTNLQVVAGQTSPNVSLYTENGVVVSRTISVPLNQHEVYLSVSVIDDHDTFVLGQIDPAAQQSVVVALRESVSGEQAIPIDIRVAPIPDDTVTTEKSLFSDDFPGTDLNRSNWTAAGIDAGALPDDPIFAVANSVLAVQNDPADTTVATSVSSDIYEGRCHVEFRQAREQIRRNGSAFRFGVYFIDEISTLLDSGTLAGSNGWIYFSTNWDGSLGGGYTPEANTVLRCNVGGFGPDFGPSTALAVPGGSTTDAYHTYAIDFDGHVARFFVDGDLFHEEFVKIPPTSAKRFVVFIGGNQSGALAALTAFEVDRVDVATDERLVTATGAGGSGGTATTVVDATPSAPTHGVTTAINDNLTNLLATVQVGKRYRCTPIGGDGVVLTNSAGPADRTTDDPFWSMQKWEFIAVHTQVHGMKLVLNTANLSVNVTPLDGGTIA